MSIIVFEIHGYKAGFTADTHNVTVPLFLKYLSNFPPLKAVGIQIHKKGGIYSSIMQIQHLQYMDGQSTGMTSLKANTD